MSNMNKMMETIKVSYQKDELPPSETEVFSLGTGMTIRVQDLYHLLLTKGTCRAY